MAYRYIKSIEISAHILMFLSGQPEGVSGRDVSKALNKKYDTVMCHIYTLECLGFIKKAGVLYELGQEASYLWARKKAQLNNKINLAKKELIKIEEMEFL